MSTNTEHWQWPDEDPFEKLLRAPAQREPTAASDFAASQEELKQWQAVANSYRQARRNDPEECQWVDEDPFPGPALELDQANGNHLPATAETQIGPDNVEPPEIQKRPMGVAPVSDPRPNGLGENRLNLLRGWERLLPQAVKRRLSRAFRGSETHAMIS